jgi:RHS repeat-associated protein
VTYLFENWNRYYDPATGRYLQPEPWLQTPTTVKDHATNGKTMQTYGYASGSPVAYIDPTGEGIVDCGKAVAELISLRNRLRKRVEENAECPDKGHDKAIEQLTRAYEAQKAKVLKHCGDPEALMEAAALASLAAAIAQAVAGGIALGAGGALAF